MNERIIQISDLSVSYSGQVILNKISFEIKVGEQWAIRGPSGSGKTTLLKAIAGNQFYRGHIYLQPSSEKSHRIIMVDQQHQFKNLSNLSSFYYQQRFNSFDSEDSITVEEDLNHYLGEYADQPDFVQKKVNDVVALFKMEKIFDERLIQLSNGENKRLQIAKALLSEPTILLLDNPFIGLDVEARQILENVLTEVASKGIHIILSSSHHTVPGFITNILTLHEDRSYSLSRNDFSDVETIETPKTHPSFNKELFLNTNSDIAANSYSSIVKMENVNISYSNRYILQDINWEVLPGERWSLSGPNGAGKSTLLSLVNADNPQAYANKIYLFARKRGTGESIWDIKRKIGYISPELHLHFDGSHTGFEVVASGLFDTIGLFRKLNEEHINLVNHWLQILHIQHLAEKMLFRLSNSEQRMVLLARAMVKNPPLLILDEPCQGLDDKQVVEFKSLVNEICLTGNKTLIYVSHYPEEIPDCVTKFIRLEGGRRISN